MSVIAVGPIPGGPELLIILLVLVLLFGANRIPKLARAIGTSIGEFQKGREELEEELTDEADAVRDEVETAVEEDIRQPTQPQSQSQSQSQSESVETETS